MSTEKSTGINAEDLKDILTTVVREARRAPDPTEKQLAEAEQDKNIRRENGLLVLQMMKNKRAEQEACIHMRRDNTTTGVYIANGNYIICQACQAKIRPGTAPETGDAGDFYDTHLFNRLFQLGQGEATFG
jgi:hypothetical protein